MCLYAKQKRVAGSIIEELPLDKGFLYAKLIASQEIR